MFTIKCEKVQKMFEKLENSQMIDVFTLRREFGLEAIEPKFIMLDPILEDIPIKMETEQEPEKYNNENTYNVTIKNEENQILIIEEKNPPKKEKPKKKLIESHLDLFE